MNETLDAQLCAKYPKIFKDRRASMQSTLMCWGFEHGDGWYNIIDALCWNIQNHIDTKREKRAAALKHNRALKQAIDYNNLVPLIKLYNKGATEFHQLKKWSQEHILEDIENKNFHELPDKVHQVVAVQVKEKFGTLRFYTHGGNDIIYALIGFAESMSGVTCEVCGAPGKRRGSGWIYTSCDAHAHKEDLDEEEFIPNIKEE